MTPAAIASRPRSAPPAAACDAHSHVFGPFDRFPPLRPSTYALPDASPRVHAAVRETLGVSRGVLVQPAPYANDPSALLGALTGSSGALKGVAVATNDVSDATLEQWRAAGIVGLRFTEMRTPGGNRYPGSVGFDALELLAPRLRALGMHAQLWAAAATFARTLPALARLGVPLVLDHMAMPDAARGVDDPAFVAILELFREVPIWIKLVVCRVSKRPPDYPDAQPFHDACVAAAPDRCLWGSDWPYVRMEPAPDAGHLLDLFYEWTPDARVRHSILVDNPERLYGFGGTG